jgi:DNA-binding NtrC family response regulator
MTSAQRNASNELRATEQGPKPDLSGLQEASFRLVVTEGADAGMTFDLDGSHPSRVLMGQSSACEVRLSDPQVSRRHAALDLAGRRLRVTDLDSTNGTTIDGVAIADGFAQEGSIVRMGGTAIRIEHRAPTPGATSSAASSFGRVVGGSVEMRRLYRLCERLAATDVPVVVEGETGTGKEALAEALHEKGPRASAPFVVFDCTAVPPSLVESELFGHERGSFTGAVAPRKGVFEQANGGTLLIDEIGDLDLALQPKLLRAIERAEVRRVGGHKSIHVDVRILAATRRDLDHEVQVGRFRDDLFHRLAVTRIELPPLRRRHGDIPLLARHFCVELKGGDGVLTPDLLKRWEDYPWPGNVRELRNAVARRIALGDLADVGSMAPEGTAAQGLGAPDEATGDAIDRVVALDLPLAVARQRILQEFERRYLEAVLARHGGNIGRAATASGVARRYFQLLRAKQAK